MYSESAIRLAVSGPPGVSTVAARVMTGRGPVGCCRSRLGPTDPARLGRRSVRASQRAASGTVHVGTGTRFSGDATDLKADGLHVGRSGGKKVQTQIRTGRLWLLRDQDGAVVYATMQHQSTLDQAALAPQIVHAAPEAQSGTTAGEAVVA